MKRGNPIKYKMKHLLLAALLALSVAFVGCARTAGTSDAEVQVPESSTACPSVDVASIPPYVGAPTVELDGGVPAFTAADRAREPFLDLAPLDDLGRCGPAFALLGPEHAPTAERGSIGAVKPSGWHLVKYDIVDGKYLFNRCHLIGYQLCGVNADERNLITGTRFLNVEGMLPYENQVAAHLAEAGGHVLLRVTPVFAGGELVARGVQLEAQSVEDEGAGLRFNVYVFNVQPGIAIDYATGESALDGTVDAPETLDSAQYDYILNVNTHRFHRPDCPSVADMKEANKRGFNGARDEALAEGYEPCGRCNP